MCTHRRPSTSHALSCCRKRNVTRVRLCGAARAVEFPAPMTAKYSRLGMPFTTAPTALAEQPDVGDTNALMPAQDDSSIDRKAQSHTMCAAHCGQNSVSKLMLTRPCTYRRR